MIGFFPDPYPDELLYSACARYARRLKYRNRAFVAEDLFGNRNVPPVVDLPCHLGRFINALPPGHRYTVDLLLDQHTLLPFYAPFLSPDRLRQVRSAMCDGAGRVYERLGLISGRVKVPKHLRFCPSCVREDRERFGETYWHRIHQITGVEVCPRHEAFLEESDVPWRERRNHTLAYADEVSVRHAAPRLVCPSDGEHALLLRIAGAARWLLDRPGVPLDGLTLRERYYHLLLERGYACYSGRTKTSELADAINRFYTPDLLSRLSSTIQNRYDSWVTGLLIESTANRMLPPLRHILLITFMGLTVEEVFTSAGEYKPFGTGPWLCLNTATDHYLQPRVTECRIDNGGGKNLGRPMGTFSCECGFVYTRTGPDLAAADRSKVTSVQAYGAQWEELLRELWDDTSVPMYQAARRLGVSELTVKRRAIYLGLEFPRPTAYSRRASGAVLERYRIRNKAWDERLLARRAEWLAVRQAHPEADRRRLQELVPYYLSYWLRRNDREWLQANMPPKKSKPPPPPRTDYGELDGRLAADVRAEAVRIRSRPGAPVRVSLAALERRFGYTVSIKNRLARLPQTAAALADVIESMVAFSLRRVEWVLQRCRQEGVVPSRSAFIEQASIKNKTGRSKVVQDAVDEALNLLRAEV